MNCLACTQHYVETWADRTFVACLVLNGCSGPELGDAVKAHVAGKAPLLLAAADVADGCPGFEAGEPIYMEKT